jgi:hypothetical protein
MPDMPRADRKKRSARAILNRFSFQMFVGGAPYRIKTVSAAILSQ